MEVSYSLEIFEMDQEGHITRMTSYPLQSFVKNWISIIATGMDWLSVAYTSTTGAAQSTDYFNHSDALRTDATTGISNYGIVVGTGSVATSITDYKLGGQTQSGTGSGMLNYQAVTFDAPSTGSYGNISAYRVRRQFTNTSSASVSFTEAGIYINGGGDTTSRMCVARDVFSPYTVVNGAGIEVRYLIQVSSGS